MTSLNLSRPEHEGEHVNVFAPGNTIIIKPTRLISFAHQIERDWDEIAREAIEGNHQRQGVARQFKGV